MSRSQRITLPLLVCLAQACGGHQTDAGPSAGNGPGSTGGGGTTGVGGASTGAGGSAAGGPAIGSQGSADKLDVLLVIDNSTSMSGKQRILASSMPRFVSRLTNPLCVDAQGNPTSPHPAGPAAACASGVREFKPLTDIHFGAITTSIGSHGGDVCNITNRPQSDDQAQLLPTKRTGVATYNDSGFLAFDATGQAGVSDPIALTTSLSAMITAAGEDGCGYEAPLEAMYRFLVDPEPPLSVQVVEQKSTLTGINDTLLGQREAFLRPDSSVAIVIFSDENDCSIADSDLGWFVSSIIVPGSTTSVRMPRASSACDTNPNDPCCRSCAESETAPPSGCAPLTQDSVCSVVSSGQTFATYDVLNDSLNLRCFDQQRRFGMDFLYPVERYSDALSKPRVPNRAGMLVDNPLFAARDGKGPRSATLISVSLIVGAPWQDLATTDSLGGGKLQFLDAAGLESNARWPLLIGDQKKQVAPSDPFMIESIAPRAGVNPLTMTAISPASSTNPRQNPINGHEMNNDNNSDLQYACTFALTAPVVCGLGMVGCDCSPDKSGDLSSVTAQNSPLCQPPAGGVASSTQYYGKAYPGARELTFARQMGARAAPASICPSSLTDSAGSDYAYGPALDALVRRIASTIE